MIRLTQEMRDLIDSALANKMPCILATASKDGVPNVGFRGSLMVFDDESLAYWERGQQTSLRNLLENPRAMVLFRNPETRVAWRFLGTATIHRDGPLREQVMRRVVAPELDRDPERKGLAVIIRVDRVLTLGDQVLQARDAP